MPHGHSLFLCALILGLGNSLKCGSFTKIQTAQGLKKKMTHWQGGAFNEVNFIPFLMGYASLQKIRNCDDLKWV